MDFFKIVERSRRGEVEIYPDFRNTEVTDLLVRGGEFYAVWDAEKGLWSTKKLDVQKLVDKELWEYAEKFKTERHYDGYLNVRTLESESSGSWAKFVNYLKRYPNCEVTLDTRLTFADTPIKKEDYISKRLPYKLEDGDYSAWDKLVGYLYDDLEREKIEWAIGAVVSGDSRSIEKFCVFYGDPGTGKGTILKVIMKLFQGYYTTFEAKALGSLNNQFSTEVFKDNPLVGIQTDGDLSRIEDNTKINTIVSHEPMVVNSKHEKQYTTQMNCFLFLGTNRPVKITDSKSGLLRRLIDITPTGKLFKPKEYDALMSQIDFQLGAIAKHCLDVYQKLGKNYYRTYRPREMQLRTDIFYNFVEAKEENLCNDPDGLSLTQAYKLYLDYCEEASTPFKMQRHVFREELKDYFENFYDMKRINGRVFRSWYSGFKHEMLEPPVLKREEKALPLVMDSDVSLLDDILADCPAQYAVIEKDGTERPEYAWDNSSTVLRDIDTKKLHFVRVPKNHIVIDFDLKNEKGEKDILKSLEAASKFPPTYAEFSKSGKAVHLHYIYDGDVDQLAAMYAPDIEIKVYRGKSALRRKLSKCNTLAVATLLLGALPLREEKKVIDIGLLKDEKHLRNIIKKSLRKDIHGATRPEVDMIGKVLDDAYESGMTYDVSDMEHDILCFAMGSTHQSEYCVGRVQAMKFKSKDREEAEERSRLAVEEAKNDKPLVFFDCEIYPPGIDSDGEDNPGLFLICWKEEGDDKPIHSLINPKPYEVEELFSMKLVGFYNREYDNHMLYAASLGYSVAQLHDLSHRLIIEKAKDAKFPDAFDLSYTDVYDFSSKKQSLKKFEIEYGISHMEMGVPWDQPAPKKMWPDIIEYCSNDVKATEVVFNKRHEDWTARQILADLAGGKVNDTTNSLTMKIVFGNERRPTLVYTDLATGEQTEGR